MGPLAACDEELDLSPATTAATACCTAGASEAKASGSAASAASMALRTPARPLAVEASVTAWRWSSTGCIGIPVAK